MKNLFINSFCWVDLTTTDKQSAIDYYSELFGWTNMPSSSIVHYDMFLLNKKAVAAINEMPEEVKSLQSSSPYWMAHIAVENIEKSLNRVEELGGTLISNAINEAGDNGLFAVIQDPEGAILGLWQGINHYGFAYSNINSSFCWSEHASRNSNISIPFYEQLFSWSSKTENFGDLPYTTFYFNERPVAGLYIMGSDMANIPCHWLPYFMISNIDTAIAITHKYNGKLLIPKTFIEHIGFFSVISDPQGGVFGLIQSA